MKDTILKLYAIKDKTTGEFINNITNPKHKFWETKGSCENALNKYKTRYNNQLRGRNFNFYNPNNLEVVELRFIESSVMSKNERKDTNAVFFSDL
jgi:hypothetical protein